MCIYPTPEKGGNRRESRMAVHISNYPITVSVRRISLSQPPGDRKEAPPELSPRRERSPADDFAPLAGVFRRRLLAGVGSASLVAVGANFAGVTSFLLGFSPEIGRRLKLDVLYPVEGYSRCLETNEGFEFIYPANWVGDQRLLYRAAGKAELERSLDPPPLSDKRSVRPLKKINEPIVAFGPPGSNGELNVSVIVSPVPLDFSYDVFLNRIEAFGSPKEVGEAVIRTISGSGRSPDINVTLIDSALREDPSRKINYYKLEFRVRSSSFLRHNVAVCASCEGRLFTLNAQAPESSWPEVREEFHTIADSFSLTSEGKSLS